GPARAAAEQLQDENERRAGQVVRSIGTDSGSESLVVATVQPPERLIASDGVALELAALPYPLQTAAD
ncbi:MAG: hypothetical protein HKM98_10460, partial [Gammaproteobacteria bacterium]|nr:hypothetical protein [Gammaproteobacteria bacterium]